MSYLYVRGIYDFYPYIRIATGDYEELVEEYGDEDAMWATLSVFAHELTHYYQHINNLPLTPIGVERQARAYDATVIIS